MFVPITKVDAVKGEIWGRAAQETLDKSGEIMDYELSKPNFQKWSDSVFADSGGKSLGNVRAMHGTKAVGKVVALNMNDTDKAVDVCVKIVDKDELEKAIEGVYTGFSVGGKYGLRTKKDGMLRYEAVPSELSLVDRPMIPTAIFELVKLDGTSERKGFKKIIKEIIEKGAYFVGELKKYLGQEVYDARMAIEALMTIISIAGTESNETTNEADDKAQAENLKVVIQRLKAFIASEIMEGDNTAMALAEMVGDLEKGDYVGHPFHGNQYVGAESAGKEQEASKHAHETSKATRNDNSIHAHGKAAEAHKKAAEAHRKAGNEGTAAFHDAMAQYHEKEEAKVANSQKSQGESKAAAEKVGDLQKMEKTISALEDRIKTLESEPERRRFAKMSLSKGLQVIGKDQDSIVGGNEEVEKLDTVGVLKKIHRDGGKRLY